MNKPALNSLKSKQLTNFIVIMSISFLPPKNGNHVHVYYYRKLCGCLTLVLGKVVLSVHTKIGWNGYSILACLLLFRTVAFTITTCTRILTTCTNICVIQFVSMCMSVKNNLVSFKIIESQYFATKPEL